MKIIVGYIDGGGVIGGGRRREILLLPITNLEIIRTVLQNVFYSLIIIETTVWLLYIYSSKFPEDSFPGSMLDRSSFINGPV